MSWQSSLMAVALTVGTAVSTGRTSPLAVPTGQARPPQAVAVVPPPAPPTQDPSTLERELFEAVRHELAAHHVSERDMPKRILQTQRLAEGHYRVHMQMVEGEAWFELRRTGQIWQVRGVSPPAH